ncbi:hypothetical protein FB45DRAFT_899785, partial [Roridomyces roridus]
MNAPNQSTIQASNPTRVQGLWFSADLIVIQAEDKIFRIAGGVLAARSSVFRDMLGVPHQGESMDGPPCVLLHDSAHDVEVFLRAVFDSSYCMPAPEPIEFKAVLGILWLSHKYDVPYLFRRALQHLTEDGWYATKYDKPGESYLLVEDTENSNTPDASLTLLPVATEVGALWLLPWAYYCAMTLPTSSLSPFLDGPLAPYTRTCLDARALMVRETVRIHTFIAEEKSLCQRRSTCETAWRLFLADFMGDVATGTTPDPLEKYEFDGFGLCEHCLRWADQKYEEAFTDFYDRLPGMFGLPSWDELKTMERAAMGD